MTCARRPAGARKPAPSTSASAPRPDARTGRARARLSLLPVLALLLGALSLFAAAPAEAQSVASPTNLAAAPGDGKLTVTWTNSSAVTAAPSNHYTFLRWRAQSTSEWLNPAGSNGERIGAGTLVSSYEITGLTNGTTYEVEISYIRLSPYGGGSWASVTGRAGLPEVTLSAAPTTVTEGSSATVTARLSKALSSAVTIPVTVSTASPNTAESGDVGTLSSITINAGSTTGAGTIATNHDTDTDDETFTVALGSGLPSGVVAGSASSVQIAIADDEGPPAVALRASPNPVGEGSSVTVTATLTKALTQPVTIPLTVRRGTAELGDYGTDYFWKPSPITIPANATRSTTTIRTNQDSDGDDETFTVALGALPSSVRAVSAASSAEVTIADDDKPAISLSAKRTRVPEGEMVLMTMTFSKPVPLPRHRSVLIPVRVTGGDPGDVGPREFGVRVDGGMTSQSFFVGTNVDADSGDEPFTVALDTANLPGWARAGDPASVALTVDDAAEATVSLSVSSTRVAEGSSVTVTATLSKALSSSHELWVPVRITTYERIAHGEVLRLSPRLLCLTPGGCDKWTAEDDDVYVLRNYIVIPAGSTTGTLEVHARQDGDVDDETFEVSLAGQRAQVTPGFTGVPMTIIDDDDSPLLVSVSDANGSEQFRYGRLCFAVTLNRAVSYEVWVGYRTENGTAIAGQDYTGVIGSPVIVFEPGETRKEKCISIIDDGVEDSGETFSMVLVNPHGAILGKARGTGTIYNHEPTSLSALAAEGASGEDGPFTALDIGTFAPATTAYTATVPHGTTHVRLTPASLNGYLTIRTGLDGKGKSQVSSGQAGPAVALAVGDNVLVVKTQFNGQSQTYRVTVTRQAAAPQPEVREPEAQQQALDPLTAWLRGTVSEHDGETPFMLELELSESLDSGSRWPSAASFAVKGGSVESVRRFRPYRFHVHVKPKSWKDVTVTLAGGRACSEEGAICTPDGRSVSNTSSTTIGGPVRIRIAGAKAKEGKDASLDFAVTLNRAAAHEVSVDYATEDDTATAGADYTATSGTLTFAAGETAKTVSVPVLDDAIDEGKETMRLLLSNPKGAYLRGVHSKAKGVIRNDDTLQQAWLARFGRMVASDAVGAVTARLETPRDAGSHVTFAGQRVNFGEAEGGGRAALATVLTGLAQTFGAPGAPAADEDDPFARLGLTDPWNDPASSTARSITGRELLLGTSFRAVLGQGAGSQWTSWGQGASVSQFSAAAAGLDLSGESATGSMGMDYERGRLLTGFAMTHSVGEGTAEDEGWRYALGSTATMAMPYARLALTDRISAWGLAGTGSGTLLLDLDGAVPQHYRTDLSMTLAAAGVRGDLVKPVEAGGFALALKADAFWVRTESDRVAASRFGNLAAARGESSRVRAVLDGSRTFALSGGAALTPSMELGLRHDGGDAETGTGVEFGTGLGYADPSRGLDMALKVHGLAVHDEDGYDEWGVSGQLRLVPGHAGRGLSASFTPSYGVDPGGTERLWALPDAHALSANGEAAPSNRLDTEFGYGLPVFGGGFTGTPNVGFGMSEAARDYRIGWRLTPAAPNASGFEVNLDAVRREAANDDTAEHGVMLRSLLRW